MDKNIQMKFGTYYYERFSKPLREKKDCILVILDVFSIYAGMYR